jgi:type II secretory pathway component GspD/PulD (secretin)
MSARLRLITGKMLCSTLSLSLLAGLLSPALADNQADNQGVLTGDVHVTVNPSDIRSTLPIAGADKSVTLSFRDVDVADALRALAKKGGFNVLVDDSVTGTISVDLNNVSIQNALETFKTYGNLSYDAQGGTLMVADANSEKGQSFKKTNTRIFSLKNANAKVVANLLNNTIFADRSGSSSGGGASSGGASGLPVTADPKTNSLIVVGSPTDIKTVQDQLDALDQPRQVRTWRLSQANVLDVATLLSSSLFNEGTPAIISGAGGSSSGGGQSDNTPSSLRVTAENITDGTGTSQPSQSGGNSGSTAVVNSMTLRAKVKQTQTIQISPNGPIIIPDTRLNTLTLLGTAEQVAMAESLIPTLDRKMPQVVLEASLIEISEDGRRELGFSNGMNSSSGLFSMGTNNVNSAGAALVNQTFSNLIGRPTSTTTPLESLFQFSTKPSVRTPDFVYQLNALVSKNKAKILANPTVVTTSDNETIISIVDEIIKSVTITVGTNSGAGSTPTATDNIGEAGIVLSILPRVGADRTVSLRVRPVISTVASRQTDRFGNLVTLLSKREILAQNTVLSDGQTFILGGLLQDTNTKTVTRDPILSRMPIVGALARNSTTNKTRTELVIMITPHIVDDEANMGYSNANPNSQIVPATLGKAGGKVGENGMVPVSLNGPSRPNALPPLEKVQVIGHGASMSGGDTKDYNAQLNRHPFFERENAAKPPSMIQQQAPPSGSQTSPQATAYPAVTHPVVLPPATAVSIPPPSEDIEIRDSMNNPK